MLGAFEFIAYVIQFRSAFYVVTILAIRYQNGNLLAHNGWGTRTGLNGNESTIQYTGVVLSSVASEA